MNMESQNGIPILTSPLINENVALTKTASQLNAIPILGIPANVPKYSGTYLGTLTQNSIYLITLMNSYPCSMTGIVVMNSDVINGNLKVGIYNSTGTSLLASSGSVAQNGTYTLQTIAFSGAYAAAAGIYIIGIVTDSATAKFQFISTPHLCSNQAVGSFAIPATVTPPSAIMGSTSQPLIGIY